MRSRHRASYLFSRTSYGGRETVVKGRADSNSSGADVNSPEKDKHVGTRYVMRDREATVIYNSCNQLAKRNDNLVTPRYSLLRPLDRLPLPGTRFSPLPLSDVFPSLSHPRSSGAKRTTGEINSSNRDWTESFDPGPLNYSRSILDDDGSVQEILVVEILTLIVGSSGYILGWEGRVCVWGSSLG